MSGREERSTEPIWRIWFSPKPSAKGQWLKRLVTVQAPTSNTALEKAREVLATTLRRDPAEYDWKIESVTSLSGVGEPPREETT